MSDPDLTPEKSRDSQETRLRRPEEGQERSTSGASETRLRTTPTPTAQTPASAEADQPRVPEPDKPDEWRTRRVTRTYAGEDYDTGSAVTEIGTLAPGAGEARTGRLLSGRYLLERRLGEGGMGTVYFASDQEVKGETFAIKVLKPEIRELPEALPLLREEVRKTRSLSHPNIVGVYSLNSDGDCVYMLMEFLEGKTLESLLDEDFGRGVPFERAWPLIQDICTAMAFAHDRSVIHSDLKPANIFVTAAGRAKLVDFGIARAARGKPRGVDPAALGALTPGYASCEMLEGHEPDSRDDIYSLACVVYEMLSGKHPFGGRTAVEAREEKRRPAPIAALSKTQNAALTRGLAFAREQRTATVEALLAELSPAAQSRGKPWALIFGIVIVAAAGAIGWWLWSNSRHPSSVRPGISSSSGASTGAALARVRDLAEQARRAEVDEADSSLVDGMQQLRAAEQQLANGAIADGSASLAAAERAIRSALRGGGRVAHIGSGPEEVRLAVDLCVQVGEHCSPDDFADEAPRTVVLHPFVLDANGVTNGEFANFAQAQGYKTEAEKGRGLYAIAGTQLVARPGETWRSLRDQDAVSGADTSGYPVRGIDFPAAKAYCASVGKRLPTEEEWEFIARPDNRIFPWGNDPALAKSASSPSLLPVSQQKPTGRFGVRGLGGMLWEWVDGGSESERVFRGASWRDPDPVHQRLAMRGLENPQRAHIDTGFRCARAADVWPDQAPGTPQPGTAGS